MSANIFQISNEVSTGQPLDDGFIALTPAASVKPGWSGYGAIREFFLTRSVNQDELYGFLSSDFQARTALTAAEVQAFIADNPGHEVYTFSPSIEDGACYLNVFEQANQLYPGFIEAAELFLRTIGLDAGLRTLPMDFRSTVYGNYVVAKPSFWETWFALTEKLFDLFEGHNPAFRQQLAATVACNPPSGLRVLLIERIASLILALCPEITVCAYSASATPLPETQAHTPEREAQLALLNELKVGYGESNDSESLHNFYTLRGAVLQTRHGQRLERAKDGFLSTQLPASRDMLYVCMTHVPLPYDYPSFVSPLYLGDAQGPGKANLRDIAPEWLPYHPRLGAVAGSFALKNYIVQNQLQIKQIGICQYRKFISTRRVTETIAPNYPVMDMVTPEALERADLAQVMAPAGRDFLFGQLCRLQGGYFNQYRDSHVAEDFLLFTAVTIELGVLGRHEVMPFFNEEIFVPGGIECGVFPTDFWVSAISSIEAVVRTCFERYSVKREGYQARAWAFCAERLGSYLLLRHLVSKYAGINWQQQFVGQLNLYTEDTQAAYVGSK
ncbi:hypothetical protein [Paraburkholderia phenazinium]|uniref:Uncharacterized protein n=1 Tax=Paraburkholderia phenazinium TaxID=60549 RepID=A0A1G7PW52_9BURK|nr:hypothetical protein [Paraburkholderia phenazinium]SDF90471.1 hypothetical protein SAMN05216466_101483 [Paraburkholderia phenazinium]